METAICFENLSKTFGRRKKRRVEAVKALSLEIAAGQVYGFLGPNGAGKTTTIRMALDLITPTQGRAHLFGQDVRRSHAVLRRVGAVVEGAAFYPYLTGRKNLEVLARTYGHYDRARIDALLDQVGLGERARMRYRGYSLGMKQRLGLAAALLHDPQLLILDEPTNGLDPAGILEMRTFIRQLVDQHGKTVFLSSHLLNEVEQTCDRVAIIHKGAIIREGRVEDLLAESSSVRIIADPPETAEQILRPHWPVTVSAPNGTPGGIRRAALHVEAETSDIPHIVHKLVAENIAIYEVVNQKQSLEAFFLKVTQEETHD